MNFENPPPATSSEQHEQISFSDCESLAEVYEILETLREKGIDIQGSQRTYTPDEVCELIFQALDKFEERIPRTNSPYEDPSPDAVPEFQQITNTGGLRDMVKRLATYYGTDYKITRPGDAIMARFQPKVGRAKELRDALLFMRK